jgi:uncharacterized protein YggE
MDGSRLLRVVAEGSESAPPDRWVLVAAINAMAESASDALASVTQMVSSATRILRENGMSDASLRTQNLLLHDWFDQAQQRVTARVASYELEITVDTLDDLESAISALTAEIADNLQLRGLRPTISDDESLYQKAQEQAVSRARAKAQSLAASAGVRLGPIQSIEEQRTVGAQLGGRSLSAAFRASAGQVVVPPVPIEPGTLSVRAFVTIVYELE